jgi:serine/threonine protein kinase
MVCILLDYGDKGDLENYIKNQNGFKLTETRIKRFIIEILLAVDHLHSNEIIHRDLKPSNIFLKGKDYQVQLGDFGIACNGGGQTRVEDVGTLLYQSPEVLDSPSGGGDGYDCRTDIWSLGCIIL